MTKVVVTELEYRKAEAAFWNVEGFECIPAPVDEAGLAAKIRETVATYAIVGTAKYTGALYDALPAGGVIARFGVGHDGIDKTLAKAKGIFCCNTPGVLDDSVAECAVGLMLSCARNLASSAAFTKSGMWAPRLGVELAGKTVAIIGYGNIGRKVEKIVQAGFGMRVHVFSHHKPETFADTVKDADFVSLHIPDTAANRNFINEDRLRAMKPSAILINTARGGVVDEDALYDAVKAGTIAGAGLDVFKVEPYTPQTSAKDLRTLDNVVMTPHLGSSTQEACDRMARAALKNISLALQGKPLEMNLVG